MTRPLSKDFTARCVFDRSTANACALMSTSNSSPCSPGDIVIIDNLGSHKSSAVRQMTQAVGARLWFLPPYSPDLDPIEHAFVKIQTLNANRSEAHQRRSLSPNWTPHNDNTTPRMQ
jgi:putative transposase